MMTLADKINRAQAAASAAVPRYTAALLRADLAAVEALLADMGEGRELERVGLMARRDQLRGELSDIEWLHAPPTAEEWAAIDAADADDCELVPW
jgi:hypothetical protein